MAGDAGTRGLTTGVDRNSKQTGVRVGKECYFAFNSDGLATSVNSKVFEVNCNKANVYTAKMDALNTAGAGRFWKVVGDSNTATQLNSEIIHTFAIGTKTDFTLARGRWWIEMTTAGSSAVDNIIQIVGSN